MEDGRGRKRKSSQTAMEYVYEPELEQVRVRTAGQGVTEIGQAFLYWPRHWCPSWQLLTVVATPSAHYVTFHVPAVEKSLIVVVVVPQAYCASMLKAFRKTLEEGRFHFVIGMCPC